MTLKRPVAPVPNLCPIAGTLRSGHAIGVHSRAVSAFCCWWVALLASRAVARLKHPASSGRALFGIEKFPAASSLGTIWVRISAGSALSSHRYSPMKNEYWLNLDPQNGSKKELGKCWWTMQSQTNRSPQLELVPSRYSEQSLPLQQIYTPLQGKCACFVGAGKLRATLNPSKPSTVVGITSWR